MPVDFFDVTGIIADLLQSLGIGAVEFDPSPVEGFDGSAAALARVGETTLGRVGRIGPDFAGQYDISEPVFGFELDLDSLLALLPGAPVFRTLPRFPAVVRDYAFVVDEQVPAAHLRAAVQRTIGSAAEKIEVFDRFAGEPLAAGKQSIGVRITLRALDRTLTSSEVDELGAGLVAALREELGAQLRG
jgi:phenylalanyl-tRNA synthetase beta chain